ncbi:MAG: S46 family peptidase [Bacteroidales bacterium]
MKKFILALSLALLPFAPLKGDEGMWLLPLIEKLNVEGLKKLGFSLSAKEIYNINSSSLKDAIVHFGGRCSAEIISEQGLVLTNHHCGYGTIQKLSTVENDMLQNGFWAMSREEEIPAPGLFVIFLETITDVTPQINKALKRVKDIKGRGERFEEIKKQLVEKAERESDGVTATLYSMYGGNSYYLITTKRYNDIRFVGAPPSSIGKFGGEVDNWMWPRHTGDFSLFRVYADQNNNPADYSPSNRPYNPKRALTISLKGIEEGDPTLMLGYPGRTNRFLTSKGIEENIATNNILIEMRRVRQDILTQEMLKDPKVRLQYSSKYAQSSNFWKKATGMNETFVKLNVVERRAEQEAQFQQWVMAKRGRIKKYGSVLEGLNSIIEARAEILMELTALQEALIPIETTLIAGHFANRASGKMVRVATALHALRGGVEEFYKDYSPRVDKEVAKGMIKAYMGRVAPQKRPTIFKVIEDNYGGDIDSFVEKIFKESNFTSLEGAKRAIKSSEIAANDLAGAMGQSIFEKIATLQSGLIKYNQEYQKWHKLFIAGRLEMNDGVKLYPDANSTMRMSYGKIKSYSPRDGVKYNFYSTLTGVMEKEIPGDWMFEVPQKLKELYNAKEWGQYANSKGELPVAFISDNDLTNGNSGSPILNGKGELIGCAFDGNWEAMSGDILFEPVLQRCISVDIRYILFIIEKFGGAKHLIDEMDIVK